MLKNCCKIVEVFEKVIASPKEICAILQKKNNKAINPATPLKISSQNFPPNCFNGDL